MRFYKLFQFKAERLLLPWQRNLPIYAYHN